MENDKEIIKKPRKWLIPVDCGVTSESALHHALELSTNSYDKIVILCLLEQQLGKDQSTILQELKEKYEDILKNIKIAEENYTIETMEPVCPREYVCEYAKAMKADYIVMDSLAHFKSDKVGDYSICEQLAASLIGSRRVERFVGIPNEQVLQNSSCPTIFIRNQQNAGPAQKKTKKKVWLVAVDGGPQSKKAIKHVVSLMGQKDRLILLKVVADNLGGIVPSKELLTSDLGGSEEQEEAMRFTREISSELRELKVNHSIKFKDLKRTDNEVGEVVIEQVLERNVDYIALGTHGEPGIGRMIHGSVSDYCVRNAVCPVLITTLQHPTPETIEKKEN